MVQNAPKNNPRDQNLWGLLRAGFGATLVACSRTSHFDHFYLYLSFFDFLGVWGPASWVGIPFEIVDFRGGFGAQLAGSESRSTSSIFGGLWGPASSVGIPFEIVDIRGVLGPS